MDKIPDPYATFKTKISNYPIEQNHWQAFKDGTKIKQLKAGTCMIKAGDPVKHEKESLTWFSNRKPPAIRWFFLYILFFGIIRGKGRTDKFLN
ncbi:hypothetical protein [Bacillus pumilus]|uniref:hypothetical protein n=1 Tax=Bacillus pumilus TaxID=1408 RepID=UPI001CD5646D|nr:hypothetical protein [Bacillus pumilus]